MDVSFRLVSVVHTDSWNTSLKNQIKESTPTPSALASGALGYLVVDEDIPSHDQVAWKQLFRVYAAPQDVSVKSGTHVDTTSCKSNPLPEVKSNAKQKQPQPFGVPPSDLEHSVLLDCLKMAQGRTLKAEARENTLSKSPLKKQSNKEEDYEEWIRENFDMFVFATQACGE